MVKRRREDHNTEEMENVRKEIKNCENEIRAVEANNASYCEKECRA